MTESQPPQADNRKRTMTERLNGRGILIRGDILALLVVVFLQIGASIWWASKITAQVQTQDEQHHTLVTEYATIRTTQIEMLQELSALRQAWNNSNGGG